MSVAIPITAFVPEAENPAMLAAAEQLSECLDQAGAPWPVELRFCADGPPPPITTPTLAITSLVEEVLRSQRAIGEVERRWRRRLEELREAGYDPIVVCTVFGYVADTEMRPPLIERIRRLNLLATSLSRELGVGIADFDRVFTLFGAGPLQTDFRLAGRMAAEVAGHAIVTAFLALGLDAFTPAEIQAAAITRHGGLDDVPAMLERRGVLR